MIEEGFSMIKYIVVGILAILCIILAVKWKE